MARDSKYDILFEPVTIGPKTLKNRFYQVPHCNGAGSEKPGMQAYNRGMKAEGGWAAVCTEYCSIHPESDDIMRVSARIWDDEDARNLSVMCDKAHEHGALAGIELWYGGPHAPCMESRHQPRGPFQIASEFEINTYPRYMDADDIRLVQRYYVDAAIRARQAGFDIVYVYGAHSYLPLQFLSPYYNKRTDAYGGSFDNRARFWRETLEKVREAVGDDCAIASRFAVDTLYGGSGVQVGTDGVRFVEHADHLVDLWDLNVGDIAEWGQDAGPSRFFPENHQKPYIEPIRAGNHTNKPVVGVGRVTSPDTMVKVIQSGQLDIIGAARPSISDPFLPRKIEEGRLDDIRECIGCNVCISRWEIGGPPLICTQNATAGEEYRRGWHPEKYSPAANADKSVLVVGAGPAGMECAMVLGKRGMSAVHLVEAAPEIGGSVNWISLLGHGDGKENLFRGTARGLGNWKHIVTYRTIQLDKLKNVEVHTGTRLSTAEVRDYGAEIVVIATGCHWARDGMNSATHEPIAGADPAADWQVTPDEVVLGTKTVGPRVLVLENEGYFMGVSVAQKLAGEGHDVTLVTQASDVGSYMEFTLEAPMMHRDLHRLGVHLYPSTMVERLDPGHVTAYNVWNPEHKEHFDVDTVVMCTGRVSDDELYRELKADPAALRAAGVENAYLIGDAAAPRMIADSIFDGHRLAREIDAPDPAIPLPFIRERRIWGEVTNKDYEDQLRG
ncbi:MAG: FAD-dependent oxidoreductase [Nocardiopsaceae bacterium]|nr:FAD-dependent oxidoreductase [Nocardiopsaceae bacterium]